MQKYREYAGGVLDRIASPRVGTFCDERLNGQTIGSPEFLEACQVDDLLRSAPTRLVTFSSSQKKSVDKTDVWESGNSLVIVGGPGSGKTTFCRWNALVDAEDLTAERSPIVPAYVALHRIPRSRYRNFDDAFLTSLEHSGLLGGLTRNLARSTKLRLYLDGLDEIPDPSAQQAIIQLDKVGTQSFDQVQIIITMRDHLYPPNLEWLPRITLGGLADPEIRRLAEQWMDGNVHQADELFASLEQNAEIRSLMATPLLATLVILVFRRKRILPANKASLYSTVVRLLCGGWDLAKGFMRSSQFSSELKVMVLSTLASDLHTSGQRDFDRRKLDRAIEFVVRRYRSVDAAMREELLNDGVILQVGGVYQFRHQSFQEFLAAKDMLGDPDETRIEKAVKRFLGGSDWWYEVLGFYFQLAEKPIETIRWLTARFSESERRRKLVTYVADSFEIERFE